jgi:hypothetical protein
MRLTQPPYTTHCTGVRCFIPLKRPEFTTWRRAPWPIPTEPTIPRLVGRAGRLASGVRPLDLTIDSTAGTTAAGSTQSLEPPPGQSRFVAQGKIPELEDFVVVGWTDPERASPYFRSGLGPTAVGAIHYARDRDLGSLRR